MTEGKPGPRALRRRERILEAATVLFAGRGIEACTVDDLVAEAGVSRATFYRAFSGLDEVIQALYQEYEERVLRDLDAALAGLGADPAGLEAVADRVMEDMRARGPFVRAMFREELRPGSASAPMQGRRVAGQVELIGRWWSERTGTPPDDDLILALILLLQSFGHLVVEEDLPDAAFARHQRAVRFVIRAVVDAYLDALVRGTGADVDPRVGA